MWYWLFLLQLSPLFPFLCRQVKGFFVPWELLTMQWLIWSLLMLLLTSQSQLAGIQQFTGERFVFSTLIYLCPCLVFYNVARTRPLVSILEGQSTQELFFLWCEASQIIHNYFWISVHWEINWLLVCNNCPHLLFTSGEGLTGGV